MDPGPHRRARRAPRGYYTSMIRIGILLAIWMFIAFTSSFTTTVNPKEMMIVTVPNETIFKRLDFPYDVATVTLIGPINKEYTDRNYIKDSPAVYVRAEWRDSTLKRILVRSAVWKVYLSADDMDFMEVKHILKVSPSDQPYGYPDNEPISAEDWGSAVSVVTFESDSNSHVGLKLILDNSPEETESGVLYTVILIVTLYAMIITDFVDRRFGCVIITMAAIALMGFLGRKPTFDTLVSWIDMGTLMVLLGSMIVVALLWETGFFDHITLVAYKTSKGHAWLLIYILCVMSALLSAFMDNCTVVLLLAPASIRLCEAAFLNTQIVLIIVAMYANIGGSMTPVGGPANILVVHRMGKIEEGIDFAFFPIKMVPVAVISMFTIYGLIYLFVGERLFKVGEHQKARRLAMELPTQEILDRMKELRKKKTWLEPVPNYYEILATLQANQAPLNLVLLAYCGITFVFLFAGFILRMMPSIMPNASFGWIAMLAAFLVLILANKPSISGVLARIEWGVLIYLSCLFIITEVIVELGLITFLGDLIIDATMDAPLEKQTVYSMLIILWMAGLCSAMLDDTPVSAVMLQVCREVAHNENTNVQIMSLVWALMLGANYGSNGTMLGSISNEFVEVIAREYGYKLTFNDFFWIGFPVMFVTLVLCTLYVLAAQAVIGVIWV